MPKHPPQPHAVPAQAAPVTPAWPALMSASTVATYLSISQRSVWRSAATGELPRPTKLAGRSLWRRSEIDAVIEGLTTE